MFQWISCKKKIQRNVSANHSTSIKSASKALIGNEFLLMRFIIEDKKDWQGPFRGQVSHVEVTRVKNNEI